MRTIEQLWQDYKKSCYPDGMTEDQEKQLRQAFCGGFMVMHTISTSIGERDVTEERALQILTFYSNEVKKELQRYAPGRFEVPHGRVH